MDLPDLADLDFADLDLFKVVSVESAPESSCDCLQVTIGQEHASLDGRQKLPLDSLLRGGCHSPGIPSFASMSRLQVKIQTFLFRHRSQGPPPATKYKNASSGYFFLKAKLVRVPSVSPDK